MGQSTTMTHVDVTAALDRFATLLACSGEAGLPAALTLLVESLGIRSAVLRAAPSVAGGTLLAVAGEVVHAVAAESGVPALGPLVELPVVGLGGREVATLTLVDARPRLLPALRVAAAVLGLVLSAEPPGMLAEVLLQAAEQERGELADVLHDGPVQDLVVARYAVESALRMRNGGVRDGVAGDGAIGYVVAGNLSAGEGAAVAESVQAALVGLRRALWYLRPRGADGLAAALAGLSTRLVEAGRRPLLVQLLPGGDDLRGSRAVAAYRLVQAVVLPEPLPDARSVSVSVTLRGDSGRVLLSIDGPATLPEPERWQRRVRALGGDLTCTPGRLHLSLPAGPDLGSRSRPLLTPKAAP